MISVDYVQTMARYNAWQNAGLITLLQDMPDADLRQDRGAFFGSILGTLNHLLWGDQTWMSRFGAGVAPTLALSESPSLTPGFADWKAGRADLDQRIVEWADTLRPDDLHGALSWYSGVMGRDVARPKTALIAHFFNHQTHHRGQVHAMLTAAGLKPQDTDLFLMLGEDGRPEPTPT